MRETKPNQALLQHATYLKSTVGASILCTIDLDTQRIIYKNNEQQQSKAIADTWDLCCRERCLSKKHDCFTNTLHTQLYLIVTHDLSHQNTLLNR